MEDSQDTSQIAKRGKKACTECRQQKARCDASQRQPCTRCERMKTECVISDPFRREHKRQKYSLLEKEAEEMRRQLGSTQPAKTYQTETAAMTLPKPVEGDNKRAGVALAKNNETKAVTTVGAGIGAGVGSGTLQPAFIVPDPDALPPLSAAAYLDFDRHQLAALVPGSIYKNTASGKIRPEPLQPPVGLGPTLPKAKELALAGGDPNRTQPRSLGGLTLSGEEIDAIFDLFYRQYAHFLPILDITSTPNQTYGRSPFLFWAVIGVASRTCAKNPTIFLALTKHITQLAFTAPLSGCGPWTIVQGLLLVLSWPFPKDDGDVDIIFPLSGLLLHVAMQYGMHNPLSAHEFYKTKLPPPSDTDILRRSELWAYTIIVYQRSCLMKGQPPRSLPEVAQDVDQRKVLHRTISPGLRIEMVAQEIVTECGAAVNEYGVINLTEEQERGLDLVLRAYEQQIANLHSEGVTSRDKLHIAVASLSVQGMHLLKNHTLFSDGRLRNLETTAYTVIDSIQSLAKELESLAVCPSQVIYGLLLAGAILLRILKGPRTTIVDNNRVKDYFMTSLNLAKSMSVTNSDLATKIVTVLSQLYNSTKAFRRADGRPTIRLRIRSRLALCPIIDAIWWWKDEFEPPLASTYSEEENCDGAAPTLDGRMNLYDEQLFTDLEWALTDEALNLPDQCHTGT